MDDNKLALINVVADEKAITIPYTPGCTIEDLCIKVCKQLEIKPVARYLFGLRNHKNKLWYPPCYKIEGKDKMKFDFRIRFKPSTMEKLEEVDEKAYNYYFHQARSDILENRVSDIIYEKHKSELIGLGVSDMYRVMLEKNIPQKIVESEYKKYIPKECIKRHAFFIKKPIHNALSNLSGHTASYVKQQYLKQFECMAPTYPYEEYKAMMLKDISSSPVKVTLRVCINELRCSETDNGDWNTLCAIEDLYFINVRHDNFVQITRRHGVPFEFKFNTSDMSMSFISALDGYYRLSVKWTFNLCGDVITPSLERLHSLKCHGPVGGEFSYAKLREKRENRRGTYIIRESETEYDVYYFDICKHHTVTTQRIEQLGPDDFMVSDSIHKYKSLAHYISSHQNPENEIYLNECLQSSEYDKSPLLLCASDSFVIDVPADEEMISSILEGGPRCIPRRQIQVIRNRNLSKINEDSNTHVSGTVVYKAIWRLAKGKKHSVALRVLKEDYEKYAKDLLELVDSWGQIKSGLLVRLFGHTLAPTLSLVSELYILGSLDAYLKNTPKQIVKTVDLVEATACLVTAFGHLTENNFVHGNIRCKNLLVHTHTDNSFIVKLTDPGIFTYSENDVHWLPPEYYSNPEMAKQSSQADVWAVGTTIWQIFARGTTPPTYHDINIVRKYYANGRRLPIPNGCISEVYELMSGCWGDVNGIRKDPQIIIRDTNRIFYQVYNSRKTHTYATVFPKSCSDSQKTDCDEDCDIEDNDSSNCESRASSLVTDRTSLPWDDLDDSTKELINTKRSCTDSCDELSIYLDWLAETEREINCEGRNNIDVRLKNNVRGILNSRNINGGSSSFETDEQARNGFEFDADFNVVLQGRIGQGFYGEVYRGILERDNEKNSEPQQVAIKKLKTRALESDIQDFEREISIMKTLKHPNIVEILGVISEPEVFLIMEFVNHGSLQSYLPINRQNLTHKKLLVFALDIATGMDYLGRKSIVHRDLAARNILVANENHVKISDFGLAQVMGKDDYYILQTNRDLPIKWYAPESLRDGKFSARSDVWSFGVTMYEMFAFGEDPKLPNVESTRKNEHGITEEGSAELLEALERGIRLACPPSCPQSVYVKIMYPCWYLLSHQRPDFATLCKDIRELTNQF